MPRRLVLLGMFAYVASVVWASRGQSAQNDPAPPVVTRTQHQSKFALLGAGSCAAQACHNADGTDGLKGREYRVALERDFTSNLPRIKDKHAQAFAVLFDERSERMLRQWKKLPDDVPAHPQREALCLRCHVHPEFDRNPIHIENGVPQFRLEDGVSCEACHGPAQRWLSVHFRPGWKEMASEARAEWGMRDTRSAAGRVRICVDCHIGSKDAEVNHDLIAAGHPWLKFEPAGEHAVWHKHWNGAKDKNPAVDPRARTDFEARLWLVGQVVSAKAGLELLAERARDQKRPWPEFAEHNCAACHHDLQASRARPALGGKIGAPPWINWHTAMLPTALAAASSPAKIDDAVNELQTLMASWRPPRDQVAAKAQKLAADLDQWLVHWERQLPAAMPLDAMARRLFAEPASKAADTWTGAVQWQHALAAVERARQDQRLPPAPWSSALPTLDKLLRSPTGFMIPRDYDPANVRRLLGSISP